MQRNSGFRTSKAYAVDGKLQEKKKKAIGFIGKVHDVYAEINARGGTD